MSEARGNPIRPIPTSFQPAYSQALECRFPAEKEMCMFRQTLCGHIVAKVNTTGHPTGHHYHVILFFIGIFLGPVTVIGCNGCFGVQIGSFKARVLFRECRFP